MNKEDIISMLDSVTRSNIIKNNACVGQTSISRYDLNKIIDALIQNNLLNLNKDYSELEQELLKQSDRIKDLNNLIIEKDKIIDNIETELKGSFKLPVGIEDEVFIVNPKTGDIISAAVKTIVLSDSENKYWEFCVQLECEDCPKCSECSFSSSECIWKNCCVYDRPIDDDGSFVITSLSINDYNKTWFSSMYKAINSDFAAAVRESNLLSNGINLNIDYNDTQKIIDKYHYVITDEDISKNGDI